MGFVVKLYLFGLLAIVPSEDDRQVSVLLLDARHGVSHAGAQEIDTHQPMMIARAERCSGDCWDEADARLILDSSGAIEPRLDELRQAVVAGGAWLLDREDLSIESGNAAKSLRLELTREDGSWWVPNIKLIAPGAEIDRRLLEDQDPGSRVVARLQLTEGRVTPYRFVVYDGEVVSLSFGNGYSDGPTPDPAQPFADWIAVEIPVDGCKISVTGVGFDGRGSRRMELSPKTCDGLETVEIALLNVPAEGAPLPTRTGARLDASPVGHHFDLYYDLCAEPLQTRPLPQVAATQEGYRLPSHDPDSMLLAALRMSDWRGSYSLPICPPAYFGR